MTEPVTAHQTLAVTELPVRLAGLTVPFAIKITVLVPETLSELPLCTSPSPR